MNPSHTIAPINHIEGEQAKGDGLEDEKDGVVPAVLDQDAVKCRAEDEDRHSELAHVNPASQALTSVGVWQFVAGGQCSQIKWYCNR